MQKLLLLGDEAIAQGAIDAGISGVFAYPGTPSTEITEYIQANKEAKESGIVADWSSNEKTAMERKVFEAVSGEYLLDPGNTGDYGLGSVNACNPPYTPVYKFCDYFRI